MKSKSQKWWADKLAALLAVAVLAACGADTGDGDAAGGSVEVSKDPVLLPADAAAIVQDLNDGSDTANLTLDAQLQDSIETYPARDIDDANFKRLSALGRTTASSGTPRTVEDIKAYVPRQTSYPARFMAQVRLAREGSQPTSRIRLYEKEAADQPWKLALYVTVPVEFAPEISLDADGFALMVGEDEADGLKLDPSRVSLEMASYLSGYPSGVDSSIFAPGRHTSELSQSFKDSAEQSAQATITSSTRVESGELPVQAFKTADGGAVVMFDQLAVTSYSATGDRLRPISGSEGFLESDQSYDTIERSVANMVAAVIPPTASESLVQVIGLTGGTVDIQHTP